MKLLTTKQQQKLVHEIVNIYLIAKEWQINAFEVKGADFFDFANMESLANTTVDAITTLVGLEGLKEITKEYGLGI